MNNPGDPSIRAAASGWFAVDQVRWARERLLENGKIARATHNIVAWRIWEESKGVQLHDNDDDGEGSCLLSQPETVVLDNVCARNLSDR